MPDTELITWRNLPAIRITGDQLTVVLTRIGGQLASLRRNGEELDPLWQPGWTGCDPDRLDPDQDAELGGGSAAPLLATIVGSNLCCERFGPPPPGGSGPIHGEVCRTLFHRMAGEGQAVAIEGSVPPDGITIRREVLLVGDSCVLTTTIRHSGTGVRSLDWCEHTSLGGPFLNGVRFHATIDRVVSTSLREEGERFPQSSVGSEIDPDHALGFPEPDAPPCGDVLCARIAAGDGRGWWWAENAALGRRLTCTFDRDDWPWLVLWTQHRSRQDPPWLGRERVRGMELSTKPMPEAVVPQERQESWLGRPTLCRIPQGPGIAKRLIFTW